MKLKLIIMLAFLLGCSAKSNNIPVVETVKKKVIADHTHLALHVWRHIYDGKVYYANGNSALVKIKNQDTLRGTKIGLITSFIQVDPHYFVLWNEEAFCTLYSTPKESFGMDCVSLGGVYQGEISPLDFTIKKLIARPYARYFTTHPVANADCHTYQHGGVACEFFVH